MLFDLRRFLAGEKPPVDVQFHADMAGRDLAGAQVPAPVQCTFSARLAADGAQLELALQAQVYGTCARCLDPVTQEITLSNGYRVRPGDLQDVDFELPLDGNGCLDVEELAYQELFLALPSVFLCHPDCPGLCPVCGRKRGACTCAPTADAAPADARLSVLKRYFE